MAVIQGGALAGRRSIRLGCRSGSNAAAWSSGTKGAFLTVVARCPVCGKPVCLDRAIYHSNYGCPLRAPFPQRGHVFRLLSIERDHRDAEPFNLHTLLAAGTPDGDTALF